MEIIKPEEERLASSSLFLFAPCFLPVFVLSFALEVRRLPTAAAEVHLQLIPHFVEPASSLPLSKQHRKHHTYCIQGWVWGLDVILLAITGKGTQS